MVRKDDIADFTSIQPRGASAAYQAIRQCDRYVAVPRNSRWRFIRSRVGKALGYSGNEDRNMIGIEDGGFIEEIDVLAAVL